MVRCGLKRRNCKDQEAIYERLVLSKGQLEFYQVQELCSLYSWVPSCYLSVYHFVKLLFKRHPKQLQNCSCYLSVYHFVKLLFIRHPKQLQNCSCYLSVYHFVKLLFKRHPKQLQNCSCYLSVYHFVKLLFKTPH